MPDSIRRLCRFRFEGPSVDEPVMWRLSRAVPAVVFDLKQAGVRDGVGVISVELEGEPEDVDQAIQYIVGDCGGVAEELGEAVVLESA
ncbi:MAG: NIL domain-containing protein [Planctomycetota bacterium]